MKFIDLYAGLGCFHYALSSLGHKCVYACEIDPKLNQQYFDFWKLKPDFNIREVDIKSIPDHDILCAGFPCQPFSLATPPHRRLGFNCPEKGDLFSYIDKILKIKQPEYFILENVSEIKTFENGSNWNMIIKNLTDNYNVRFQVISPHELGIPQRRKRMFIVGSKSKYPDMPSVFPWFKTDIRDVLQNSPTNSIQLRKDHISAIAVWDKFINMFLGDLTTPSTVLADEFGATYEYEDKTPYSVGMNNLRNRLGSFGRNLDVLLDEDVWRRLPSYTRRKQFKFPEWKIRTISQNRIFYENNKQKLDTWKYEISKFAPTMRKLIWPLRMRNTSIWDSILQLKPSGVAIFNSDLSPTFITKKSAVPIIAWERRYLTLVEMRRLQGLSDDFPLPSDISSAVAALGNGVNAEVVTEIAKKLIR